MRFVDRADAGKKLAQYLHGYANKPDVLVIALPRGGVVTGFEIAKALHVPLDIVVTRKLGAPGQPELAVGALTQEGAPLFNTVLLRELGLSEADLATTIVQERHEAQRRLQRYREGREPLDIANKIVIITDDGIATGATMRAALETVRALEPKKIILAIPVCPPLELETLRPYVDELVCLYTPEHFWGVGGFYEQFEQVTDDQVCALLQTHTV